MSVQTMDVFALRDAVVDEYRRFATSFTTIHAEDVKRQVEAIYADGRFWPEPLIQINPNFKRSTTVEGLVNSGMLLPKCAELFRSAPGAAGETLKLYKHQEQAVALAAQGESFVVTTGTGSGKSLCFFIPIVNAVLAEKEKSGPPKTRAIVIYPMNALANSQLEELDKFAKNVLGPSPITFARYTGQEDQEDRRRVAENPPDILLTNFMMLELLMTRQDELDRMVMGNCVGLRFLVLDELHTYRGRQGADVALLVRRVRERLAPDGLQCIGTSATMASEGTLEDKSRAVAGVASRLFAAQIPESSVIVETLERVTDPTLNADSARPSLGAIIDAGISPKITNAALRTNPLAVWVETRLGISWSEVDQRWQRARPLTVTQAVESLSKDSGRDPARCGAVLRDFLLASSIPGGDRTGSDRTGEPSFFAFKLHQFISGAGHAFATLEAPGGRVVTVDGQQFFPGETERRLYPLHFCRECGQEYHPVRLAGDSASKVFFARDIDDAAPPRADEDAPEEDAEGDNDKEIFGFLTLAPSDEGFTFADREEDYPEAWVELNAAGQPRLKATYRRARAQSVSVTPDGKSGAGIRAWFLPGKFRFCLRCGATHGVQGRDRNRLASLSAEGRCSATTVLVASVLRWMHGEASGLGLFNRKLLGFSDNRQDAALQAGHFNDFLFVSLVRSGFLGALETAGEKGLRSEELGAAQQQALGFDRPGLEARSEWLLEPSLKGFNLQEAEATLRQVLAYRVWFDQRRGWRYTNPNLEQLDLLAVDYLGLDDLAADDSAFAAAPAFLRIASAEVRKDVYRTLLDYLRQGLAVRSHFLDPNAIEQMLSKSHSRLRTPWGFGIDEKPRRACWLLVSSPSRRALGARDDDLILRSGIQSTLGKQLRSSKLWGGDAAIRALKAKDFNALVTVLLSAATTHGLVSEEATPFDEQTGWRLNDACVLFRVGGADGERDGRSGKNTFFRDLYSNLAHILRNPVHPLFGFEAREHTAQVEGEKREIREKRFRYGEKERKELAADDKRLREVGEANRFLPVLFCSPTMELGVDISALNAIFLRNVPPTPANYAQRSGRAGRSGQAALALSYCAAQSPHDQYFFLDPKAMVHGEVRPPILDLANRELVESHLNAVWLACTEKSLNPSIAEILVLNNPARPLRDEIRSEMSKPEVAAEAAKRMVGVLRMLEGELTPAKAPWYSGVEAFAATVAAGALEDFDDAFARWRDLFEAAEQQRDAARRTMDNYAAPPKEKRAAKSRHSQAIDQIELLMKGTSSFSSDFYTYRFLATEGFLPGYNFPRLPLMAYIPATGDGRGRQTYLQRPRFLALAEFGPGSLVYHEGRAYRVDRALLALGQREDAGGDTRLPTQSVRICRSCGAGHFNDQASLCIACREPLGTCEIVNNVYRIENVATRPVERITANDEERRRQGFDLQTTFEWAERDHVLDVRHGASTDAGGELARLSYGPGATITRLNKGLRRRANRTQFGFRIDPLSGYWAKNEDDSDEPPDPTVTPRQWIVPSVQDRKNALLLQPSEIDVPLMTLATVQHALMRGIEAEFQLEEGEILVEPMPTREERNGFLLYEATEGGAGVLTRLVSEPDALARVSRAALEIMHFRLDPGSMPGNASALIDVEGTTCVAACYRCLMSYFNQPDHELLDRRDEKARALLLRLARATTSGLEARPLPTSDAARETGESRDLLTRWHTAAAGRGIPPSDAAPLTVNGTVVPLVWRTHYVAVVFNSSATPAAALADKGFEVVVFESTEESWGKAFDRLASALGRTV
jgi:superfamily II DNA/RNA helicase